MPTSDPKKQRRYAREYALRHPERVMARTAAYRELHREELALKQWRYYQRNKEQILARRRARKTKENS